MKKLIVLFLSCSFLVSSCGVYSFTGASISPDIKTVTVQNFGNQSQNTNARISQNLTDQLKDKFLSETNLNLVDRNGDIEFKGAITKYDIRGQAPTANQTTAINRLTIAVKVEYTNRHNEKENWTQTFSWYDDYENTQSLESVEEELYQNINAQLAEDIFNKAFVNW